MIEREFKRVDLEEAFFDVDVRPIYYDRIPAAGEKLKEGDVAGAPVWRNNNKFATKREVFPKYVAVMDCEREKPIIPVTTDYKLITNRRAYELAGEFVAKVFNRIRINDMTCWNVRLSRNRGVCYIDLLAVSEAEIQRGFGDREYIPFVRIINSYNKTQCLSYEIGFCRWICLNGMIFGSLSVKFKTNHSVGASEIYREVDAKIDDVRAVERRLTEDTDKLKRFQFSSADMLPMFCKVFGVRKTMNAKPDKLTAKRYVKMRDRVGGLWNEYSSKYGDYGYAAFNVLTDFASYPEGVISSFTARRRMQGLAGEWIGDFSARISSEGFSISEYIGEEAYATAHWMDSLVS